MSSDPATDRRATLWLHSSWRGLVSGVCGGAIVTAAGVFSTAATGGAVGSLILLAVGLVILVVVVVDFPVSSAFDRDGVTRRPLLRRHRIEWDRVDQLTRTRPSIAARTKNLAPGGLAAKVGRRRYLLVDQCESLQEYQRLLDIVAYDARDIGLDELIIPPTGMEPTFTYRRRRWQRQSAGD